MILGGWLRRVWKNRLLLIMKGLTRAASVCKVYSQQSCRGIPMEEGAICSVIMHARAHTGTQKSNGPLTVSSMLRGSPSMYKFVLD